MFDLQKFLYLQYQFQKTIKSEISQKVESIIQNRRYGFALLILTVCRRVKAQCLSKKLLNVMQIFSNSIKCPNHGI